MERRFAVTVNQNKMRKFLIITLVVTVFNVSAQNSILEDREGEGSVKILESTISLNAGESAIKSTTVLPTNSNVRQYVEFYKIGDSVSKSRGIVISNELIVLQKDTVSFYGEQLSKGDSIRRVFYQTNFHGEKGFTINAIASDGTSNLFSEGKLDPKGEASFFRTFYGSNDSMSMWDFISLSIGLSAKDISLVNTSDLFADPVNQTTLGLNLEVNYNRIGSAFGGTSIFGVGVSYINRDNSPQLAKSVYDVSTNLASSGAQVASMKNSISGYDESAYVANIHTLNINLDYGVYPSVFNDRLLIAGQLRGKAREMVKPKVDFGVGFYLSDEHVSTKIIGGINVIATDLFKTHSSNPFGERISINLVTGFRI